MDDPTARSIVSTSASVETVKTGCCVVGGGPAGIMLGFLLARAGVDVLVLEKHKDFFRDFRGDTIHPSTLELLHELGLLDEFLQQPHQELREVLAHFGETPIHVGDFTHLPTHCKFIAFMPQWDFLNFLSGHARRYPNFRLRMEAEVNNLLFENGHVVGAMARTHQGTLAVRAQLVVGADGRSSTVRERGGLEVIDWGAPIDVLWFRLSKHANDPPLAFGFVNVKQFMVLIDRADYWQCAYVIPKGGFEEKRVRNIKAFREEVARCAPFLGDRTDEIKQWDDVKLLSVKVDHLHSWCRKGLLCIGDSAHAMSPVGGVGINLAIQDAVATANLLAAKLLAGQVQVSDLQAVQDRRGLPARMTQRVQVFLHKHLLERIFNSPEIIPPPLLLRLCEKFPRLRRIPARMVGIGFRPERVQNKQE
jgi:2-polyprenyl-6-methoxyphenol hydroxylase-like FAD-dependent oxidoreductase